MLLKCLNMAAVSGVSKEISPPLRGVFRVLGGLFSYLKILSILLIISGQNPFILLGLVTPQAWTWSQENKVRLSHGLVLSQMLVLSFSICYEDFIRLNVML